MYRSARAEFGVPSRLYRETSEIRADIMNVKRSIRSINDKLNIRNMLLDLIAETEKEDPKRFIPALFEALSEAEEAMEKLSELKEELGDLEDELYEVRCELGI